MQKKFGAKVECVEFKSFKDGQDKMKGLTPDSRALLIWGNWQANHYSNILNIPGSVKYVFANHSDELEGGNAPDAENHNQFSRNEGVIVRVCYKVDQVRGPLFMTYDYEDGNGIAHVSIDVNLLKGFPNLPQMTQGTQEIGPLSEYVDGVGKRLSLRRLDIGGFADIGLFETKDMGRIFAEFYEGFIAGMVNNGSR